MKIVIAGVMYSPNLGDGLIAECLTHRIRTQMPSAEVCWLDLAGRTDFVTPSSGIRTLVLSGLARLPLRVSEFFSERLVSRQISRHLRPLIEPTLVDASMLVVGGGQLLGDANLNFPLKLAEIANHAEATNLPMALHAVGVSENWSPRGRALFGQFLLSPQLQFLSVRDERSAESLLKHYRALGAEPPVPILVFPDPGILTNKLEIAASSLVRTERPTIGLGIVHPAAINTHAAEKRAYGLRGARREYAGLIAALRDKGAQVYLFTNGAGEDEEMLDLVWADHVDTEGVQRLPRATDPMALVASIRDFDAIASHRLHACIAANAVGTRAVGFEWDKKIDAYFALTCQQEMLLSSPADIDGCLAKLLDPKKDQFSVSLADLQPRVDAGISELLARLS